ncbi:HNH endonuclease [Kiloniella laminariae]|uniref:HNH endonuclease n=1 Tax=Kiloniella laminariae TaxID=454162 RepID=A0ABT4LKN0_9PROT|nr:HNH endonuclease [Kiloniella laminariae]MCZ4281665.1 HNH endonuclease [Kiloniella laminariae]
MVSFSANPALVLNADFRPLSYFPLSLLSWQDTIKAVFLDRVQIVSEYDSEVHSPSFQMRLPSVVALKDYVQLDRRPAFTRFNVFLRDSFTCQYCGVKQASELLTFDHVVPRCQGGGTSWENIVTACQCCNLAKGGRSPGQARMSLQSWPCCPTVHELNIKGRAFPPNYLHQSWRDFLYWDTELEGESGVSLLH